MYYISYFLLCAGALGSCVSKPSTDKPLYSLEDAEYHFNEFVTTHNRIYSTEAEKQRRFDIFKQTLIKINDRNSDPHETATFGINQFADLTKEEFIRLHTGFVPASDSAESVEIMGPITTSVPDNFDWREHNAVTPVKDQGGCLSCWAFSTTGVVEGAYAIKHNKLVSVSEEQLIECDKTDNNCHGGDMQRALRYIIETGGVESEEDYPYTSINKAVGQCKFDKSKVAVQVANFSGCLVTDEEAIRSILISSGPISIGIASNDIITYTSGILSNCAPRPLDHGVLLVGYGEESGTPYWIIKNSWGTKWGDKGYIRVKRGINACGLKAAMTTVTAA